MLLTWRDSLPNILHRDPVPLGLSFVTVGLIYIQPGFWLTIAAIMATWWIVYLHPEVGVVWAIFWSPFFLFPVELYRFAFPVAEVLVLVTMSAWVLRSIVDWAKVRHNRSSAGLKSIKLNIIDYAVIGWLLIAVVSLTWAEYADAAITDLRVMFIEPALFYLVLRSLSQRNPRVLWNCILTLLTAGVTISAIGLFQYAQGQALITAEDGAVRLASVYGSPNNLGLFLGRCIPFVVSFLLLLKNGRFKLLAALALGLMGLTVLLSQSAGAIFIGVPAAVVAVILLIFKRRALYPLLALLGLVVIGLLIAVQFPRFARLLDFSSGTNFYRLRVWESAVDVIHDHPVLGLGLDQFLYAFRGHYIRPDAWQEPNLSHPHNIILDFWVRLGIAGLFILGAFQIGFWRRMLRQYWVEVDNHQLILLIGAMGCMVNLLAHGLIDNSIYVNDLIYVFMLLLAIAAAPFEAATPETATKSVHLGGLKPVKHNV
jgi:O-antigen ligase